MNMEMVMAMFSDLAITVVVGLFVLLFATIKRFLLTKIALIKEEQERQIAQEALWRMENLIDTVVKKVQQTVVADMKSAASDGKLSRDEIMAIKDLTKQELNTLAKTDLKAALAKTVGDVDLYIKSKVEAKVLDLKKDFTQLPIASANEISAEELEAVIQ